MFKETSCKRNENVSDAFEALIEMWNIQNQKKLLFQRSRRPILDYRKNRSQSSYVNSKQLLNRNNSAILDDILEDEKTFKIVKGNKKKEKKKCHC